MKNFNKNTTIIEDSLDKLLGFKVPFTNSNTGYFDSSITTAEQAEANLKNLILTQLFERPMRPNLGTSLRKLFFEQNVSENLIDSIIENIKEAINYWLPSIIVRSVTIQQKDHDFNIRLSYSLKDEIVEELDLNLIGGIE